MFNHILVVCTGNICRSPMGEAWLTQKLHEIGEYDIEVRSAGINALVGHPADPIAQRLMLEHGVDLSRHRARQLNQQLVQQADLILVMDLDQKEELEYRYPTARGKVYRLGEWIDSEIPDPYRLAEEVFVLVFGLITKGITEWLQRLSKGTQK